MPEHTVRTTLRAADTIMPGANLAELAEALDAMAEALGDGMTAMHVGPTMTCTEANAVADVLRASGHPEAAETWLDGHGEGGERDGDIDAEDYHHGRHIRGRILDRYSTLLRNVAEAGDLPGDEFRLRWEAARARLADAERYADGRDFTARYELPGAA